MRRLNFPDICEGLAPIYLRDFEIADYYREGGRGKFVNLVKQRLFDDIWHRMGLWGEKTPPFLRNQGFIRQGCKAYIEEVSGVKRAFTEVKQDKFIIYVERNLPNVQKRTCIAHELGHAFLYSVDRVRGQRYLNKDRSSDLLAKNVFSRDEGLVYEIGRFLLAPTNVLQDYVPRTASLDAFLHACETFETTKDIMAARLLWDTYDWQSQKRYWEDALLLFCHVPAAPLKKAPHQPKGIGEVFRGKLLRNLEIGRAWALAVHLVRLALNKPGMIITSNECERLYRFQPLIFKGAKVRVEAIYVRWDHRAYVLLTPETKELQETV